ncbi:MAG: hypothetical protein JST92_11025, partial [Deltaproteobacteria bacterium]|nr:hypothetical protein [Deltaproteobacteria bacterium]
MVRPALFLSLLAATAAPAIDLNYCQDNPPSANVCANENWLNTCLASYGSTDPTDAVNNPCQVKHAPIPPATTSTSYTEDAYNNYTKAHPAFITDKVFDPSLDNFRPSAARAPMKKPLVLDRTAGPGTWANQELMAQYAASQLNSSVDPTTYQRYGLFGFINGITSCEQYTYASFRDMERWIDGINACKDDARCKVNVSMLGYTAKGESKIPGIARRRPQNYDGNYIYDPTDPANHITTLIARGDMAQIEADPFDDSWQLTTVPKNAFHAGTEYMITPTIFAAMVAAGVPQVQDLANELARGDNLYQMGQGVTTPSGAYYLDGAGKLHQGFYDEYAFHNYMNITTQNTTIGESREYKRRNDSITAAYTQLGEDMKCLFASSPLFDQKFGTCSQNNMPSALGKVHPGDEQIYESDPFSTWSIMSAVAPIQMAQPPALFGQVGFGQQTSQSRYSLDQLTEFNITQAAQTIPVGMHAPGMLSASAITNSRLFGSLNLPPAMVAQLSAVQVENIAAVETRVANILAGQALQFGGGLGGIFGGGLGAIFGGGNLLSGGLGNIARGITGQANQQLLSRTINGPGPGSNG